MTVRCDCGDYGIDVYDSFAHILFEGDSLVIQKTMGMPAKEEEDRPGEPLPKEVDESGDFMFSFARRQE